LPQSRTLLATGVYKATRGCLFVYGRHRLNIDLESPVEGGGSEVDYVLLVDNDKLSLCEAKSPSVMHAVGQGLPERGIKLKWVRDQSLIPKIFAKVSMPFPISYNTDFKMICIGRLVFRSESHGMAVSYLP
jgi:hypothetical protein